MNRIIKILAAAVLLLTVFTFAVHAEPTVAFGDNSTNCMLYGQTYELYLTEIDPSVPVYFKGKPSSRIQIKNDNQVVILPVRARSQPTMLRRTAKDLRQGSLSLENAPNP